jgi:lambda family phage minor tail protein L
MAVPFSELQAVAPSSIIELFELQLNTTQHGVAVTYRFHAGSSLSVNDNLIWAGNSYLRFPIEAEGFEYNGEGQLPRPKIRVSNILGTITALLLTLPSGLEGAKITRIRTLARYIDAANFPDNINPFGTPDSTASFPPEVYFIDRKTTETRDVVEFELAAVFDLANVRAPRRQCIANICQWTYRSAECGYTEALYFDANDGPAPNSSDDVCGKRLDSCRLRFDKIERTASIVNGSTTITVNTTNGIIPGHPIFGFGIPTGTTVTSITNATQLVMSQAATATNSATTTGTVSSTGATISVASTTNIRVGMTITGLYIPAGTTVTAINGTTLSLSARPYEFTRVGSFLYGLLGGILSPLFQFNSVSGIATGYRVFGSQQINATVNGVESPLLSIILNTIGTFGSLLTDPARTAKVTLYFIPAAPSNSTYTFTFRNKFVFRTTDAVLPYGSYPGVGGFFS